MKYLPFLGALLLSASPALADDYEYLECKGRIEFFEVGGKQPVHANKQILRITIDEPNERIISSMDARQSTEWRPVIIDKDQIKTMARETGSEEVLVIDRANLRYSLGGYLTLDSSKVITYNAEGNCKLKKTARF